MAGPSCRICSCYKKLLTKTVYYHRYASLLNASFQTSAILGQAGARQRVNNVGIQMLSEPLYKQVFRQVENIENPESGTGTGDLEEIKSHLKRHDLWGKPAQEFADVDFQLPPMHGENIDEHFRHLANKQLKPYIASADVLARSVLPPMPKTWEYREGWTKYLPDGSTEAVDYPPDDALVFDVEVLMSEGQFPTLATAVSHSVWYSWCSEALVRDSYRWNTKPELDNLIPLEGEGGVNEPRLVIGHNVGFDRAFVREQYYLQGTRMRFMDTMSLHIAISGLTSFQRILYQASKNKSNRKEVREMEEAARFRGPPSTRWLKEGTLNNLADVYKLHCSGSMEKGAREVFVEGTMAEVREQFQKLMTYCATDVKATYQVFKKLWPQFFQRFPHPVTLAGMMEMGTTYLPINVNWERYVAQAEAVYMDLQNELQLSLMQLANEACSLLHSKKYQDDPWLWDQNWSTKPYNFKKIPTKKPRKGKAGQVEPEEDTEESRVKKALENARLALPKRPTHMAGYPLWYGELCPTMLELQRGEVEGDDIIHRYGPSKISVQRRITPKLLRMTWEGFPLHYDEEHGWGYLIPQVTLESLLTASSPEDLELEEEEPEDSVDVPAGDITLKFPLRQLKEVCWPALQRVKQADHTDPILTSDKDDQRHLEQQLQLLEARLEGGSLSGEDHARLSQLYLSKQRQLEKLAAKEKRKAQQEQRGIGPVWHKGDGPYDVGILCVWFYKLPHKDGPGNRVGNPLAKDFMNQVEAGVLAATQGAGASRVLNLSIMCSYWKNNRDRIMNQMVVSLKKDELPEAVTSAPEYDEEALLGAILPRVVQAGTVTRRAVEPTWLTASNAYRNRIGSELKGMIQCPPGYKFVGADVDSQELWIAAILGDAHFAGEHGCTAFGWMTLQGQKSQGTDLHSKTASLVGISRDQAKIFNYGRIYGAGQLFAQRLLMQFNHRLTLEEAKTKAKAMYTATKGQRSRKVKKKRGIIDEETGETLDEFLEFDLGQWKGGSESHMFNKLECIAKGSEPRTPVLGCRIPRTLEPKNVNNDFMTSRINWVVQSSAVDYLHLMLVCMRWLFEEFGIDGRFCVSIHDEVRYLVRKRDSYRAALALQITNLLTRSMFAHKLGMHDLPQSVAFFSAVDIDLCLRKEVNMDCETPSNPGGMLKNYNLPHGESLDIYQVLAKTKGSLNKTEEEVKEQTPEDTAEDLFLMMMQ